MTVQRREFLSELGVFAAAGAMGPVMRAFAAVADDAAHPLDAYWAAHLSAVAEKVRVHAKTATDGFWFITDLHVTANCRQSGKALAALTSLTPLRKTFCGGDLPGAFGERFESDKAAVDFAVDAFHSFWRDPIERAGQRLYMAKGNHDFTIKHDAETPAGYTCSAEAARAIVMGTKGCAEAVTNDADPTACYYYVDQEAAKIRYIVADTSDSINATRSWWAVVYGMGLTQLNWLASRALATLPAGWGAVVIHHIPLTGCEGYEDERRLFAPFRELLEAYQNRGRTTIAGTTYDFTAARGRILLDLTGHYHAERQTFQNGILHVTEPCDAAYEDYILGSMPWCGELPRKKRGMVSEQTFDAVQLDVVRDLVYFTRVGGGQDRTIHLSASTITEGMTYRFDASLLEGPLTWGCYDADRIAHTPNPKNRYNPFISYFNEYATIAADGTLTAKKAGEVMVVAMDARLNKEIFPVRIARRA